MVFYFPLSNMQSTQKWLQQWSYVFSGEDMDTRHYAIEPDPPPQRQRRFRVKPWPVFWTIVVLAASSMFLLIPPIEAAAFAAAIVGFVGLVVFIASHAIEIYLDEKDYQRIKDEKSRELERKKRRGAL